MTIPAKQPASAGELYLPTGISQEEAFQAIGRLRQEAQDEIERLLAFLDATEVDADLEPTLGFPEPTYWDQKPSDPGATTTARRTCSTARTTTPFTIAPALWGRGSTRMCAVASTMQIYR
jgi:hypothetical protein